MFENLPKRVKVVEVGPRDGFQNEAKPIASADKIRLIEALAHSGLKNIEITSFVSPKWIPQLADGLTVARSVQLPRGVISSAVVPNLKGYELAKQTPVQGVAFLISASESHSKKNINRSIEEALSELSAMVLAAKADKKFVRTYLSVVFGCPYEGNIACERIAAICQRILVAGVDEIALSDTIGAATPLAVWKLIEHLRGMVNIDQLALHFHDTRGTALANVLAGLESGIKTFDASIGGMGGCPYAPGAAGNLATEDLVYLLTSLGVETGVDLERLIACGHLAEEIVGKQLPSRYLRSVSCTDKEQAYFPVEKKSADCGA